MGLLRTMARTAVISGTATNVSNRVDRRQRGRWAAQTAASSPAPPPPAPAAAPTPAPVAGGSPADDRIARLKELAGLRDAGVLTDAEFDAEKQRVLNA